MLLFAIEKALLQHHDRMADSAPCANYRVAADLSVFARYSRGGRANADCFAFGGNTSPTSGALLPGARPVDFVKQAEIGTKYQTGGLSLYATGFYACTQEQNYASDPP